MCGNNHSVLASIASCTNSSDDVFLTREEYETIIGEVGHYENLRAIVIEALKIVQRRRGWIRDCDVVSIAKILGISARDVEEVATFYSQIFRQSVGKHIIRFCDSVVCYVTGCKSLQALFKDILNVEPGQTTSDNRFTFLPISCLGRCEQSPVIMINEDVYGGASSKSIEKILEKYL